MDNENVLDVALAEMIQKITSGADHAAEFLKTEIPEVIEQLLLWNMIESLIYWVLSLILIIASPFVGKKLFQMACSKNDTKEVIGCVLLACLGCAGIFIVLSFFTETEWIKIIIAPKVWLLDYMRAII